MSVSPLGSSEALSGIQQRGTEGRQRDNADCGTTMQRVLAPAELLVLRLAMPALSMICTPQTGSNGESSNALSWHGGSCWPQRHAVHVHMPLA